MYYTLMTSKLKEIVCWKYSFFQLIMVKNSNKNKASKNQNIDQAIENDERFAGIMKDPVRSYFSFADFVEI